jgi:hypothetical protein
MRRPRGIPADLDAGTSARIEHTFLVVRIVRGSLLALFLAAACFGVEAKGWPHGATIVLAAAALLLTGRVVADVRRLRPDDRRA